MQVSQLSRSVSIRRLVVALGAAVGTVLLVGIPTDLIDTPWFGRDVPPTWWAWPALLVTSALTGALAATYVRDPDAPAPTQEHGTRRGVVGATLTFFAVGCPVCNKLVLIALGYTGAMQWFAPVQWILQVAAIALLGWALRQRLRSRDQCPVPAPD